MLALVLAFVLASLVETRLISLVFTSDPRTSANTSAIAQKGQILILVLVLAASTSKSIKMQCACAFARVEAVFTVK